MIVTMEFYKSWHEETTFLQQKMGNEQIATSEAEQQIKREKSQTLLSKVLAQTEAAEKHAISLPLPHKRALFNHIVKQAIKYAKTACIDISYEAKKGYGFLRFEMDQVIIDQYCPNNWIIWRRLLRHADSFWINPIEKYHDPALQISFYFDFRKNCLWNSINK